MKEPRCRGDAMTLGVTMLRYGVAASARSHTKISLIQTLSCDGKDVAQTFERGIDFIARCRAPKAEPDRPHSHVGRDAHRLQNRRQLDASGMTRRSRGGRHAIEPRQYLAAGAAHKGDVEGVRQPVRGMAVENHGAA